MTEKEYTLQNGELVMEIGERGEPRDRALTKKNQVTSAHLLDFCLDAC